MNVTSLTIPAGQTVTVPSSLTITSSGPVEIDGTMAIAPGAAVAIYAAGPITINGSFSSTQPSTSGTLRRTAAGRRPLDNPPAAVNHVFDSPSITWNSINNGTSFNPGDGVSLVTPDATGTITINTIIKLKGGSSGSDPTKEPGAAGGAQQGGSIEIGTDIAKIDANLAGFNKAGAPATLTISGYLFAGNGGNGASDVNGTVVGDTVMMHSGDGAAGGSVDLAAAATTVTNAAAIFSAGLGGNGGPVGYDRAGTQFATKVDGATGYKGLNLSAQTGNGGNGGNVSGVPGTVNASHGFGGAPGSLDNARAGNGSSGGTVAVSPGLDGGSTTVVVGNYGVDGTGGQSPAEGSGAVVFLSGGGSGGPAGSPPAAVAHGGNGGAVTVTGGLLGGALLGGAVLPNLHFTNYANGGTGFNGCPLLAGSPGGNGGSVASNAAFDFTNSFNGGNGGAGVGPMPAPGGLAGLSSGKPQGKNGAAGALCSASAPSPSPSPSPTPTPAAPSPSPSPTAAPGSLVVESNTCVGAVLAPCSVPPNGALQLLIGQVQSVPTTTITLQLTNCGPAAGNYFSIIAQTQGTTLPGNVVTWSFYLQSGTTLGATCTAVFTGQTGATLSLSLMISPG